MVQNMINSAITNQTTTQPTAGAQPNITQPKKKGLLKKQIPTIIGIGVLLVALVAGIMFFGEGTGVFAPRATPQTTPKKIKLTNVSDSGFTVSFLTDEATAGFIKYGTGQDDLKSQASDDRDQLSGSVGKYQLHHITLRGLQPNTSYHYTLGTGSGAKFDNNGQPFTVKTTQRAGAPSAAKTVYGSVVNQGGNPADGSIVYLSIAGVGEMSSLVKSSGSWAIPLSNARTADGSQYATITDDDTFTLVVQGPSANLTSQISMTVGQAQPVPNITLGQDGTAVAALPTPSPTAVETQDQTNLDEPSASTESSSTLTDDTTQPVERGGLSDLVSSSTQSATAQEPVVLDLEEAQAATAAPTITSTQPTIKGMAAPQVKVTIVVNSDTQITQELISDANGGFTLDIAALQKQLEPGEHTVTYSYIDPDTGKEVTKTQTFYVNPDTSSQIALASSPSPSPSSYPYGSGNPYSIGGATQSATATSSATSSSRISVPSTSSGVPKSGSVGTTYALIIGGIFFILAGAWSFWIAQQLEVRE